MKIAGLLAAANLCITCCMGHEVLLQVEALAVAFKMHKAVWVLSQINTTSARFQLKNAALPSRVIRLKDFQMH